VFSPAAPSAISGTDPDCTPDVITGASSVPVMMTVNGWLTAPPWPSSTVAM
jgi:hypothetical protein